jgi:3-deoxy-D-manno-octulosonic-acid transferase
VRDALSRLVYDAVFFVFSLVYLPLFLLKGKHKAGFMERFGFVPAKTAAALAGKKVLWVHGVSVGEVVLALRLVDELRGRFGIEKFVLTTTTAAGREVAAKGKRAEDELLYFPADFRGSVRRFAAAVRPASVVILETEIWPNLLHELSARNVPVYLLNGRISDRAIGKYRLLGGFLTGVLSKFNGIGVQDEVMRERFVEIGAPAARVHVTGNIKFDWQPTAQAEEAAEAIGRRVRREGATLCVAGSTHEGEEAMIFGAYTKVRERDPRFGLVVAPRHMNRLASVEAAAARARVTVEKLSGPEKGGADAPVYVLDRMGVLASLYRHADIVFMGGSLVPVGGHNLVEPAYYEKPIVFGPYMQNFKEMAAEFKKAGAAVEVRTESELADALASLASDAGRRSELGAAAKRLVQRHQGATRRNIERFLSPLEPAPVTH